jgi:hypothetical protein
MRRVLKEKVKEPNLDWERRVLESQETAAGHQFDRSHEDN